MPVRIMAKKSCWSRRIQVVSFAIAAQKDIVGGLGEMEVSVVVVVVVDYSYGSGGYGRFRLFASCCGEVVVRVDIYNVLGCRRC